MARSSAGPDATPFQVPHGEADTDLVVVAGAALVARLCRTLALGRILDRAGYAPEDANRDDAVAAWRHADSVRDRIRTTMPLW